MTMRNSLFAIVFLIFLGIVNITSPEEKSPENINDIFECLMCPNSDCSRVLFDIANKDDINTFNLRSASQKTLAEFISGGSQQELDAKKDELKQRYGEVEGALLWRAGELAVKRYNMEYRVQDIKRDLAITIDNLEELIAEIDYKSTNAWISKHKEEAALFFGRYDVREIESIYTLRKFQKTCDPRERKMAEEARREFLASYGIDY